MWLVTGFMMFRDGLSPTHILKSISGGFDLLDYPVAISTCSIIHIDINTVSQRISPISNQKKVLLVNIVYL